MNIFSKERNIIEDVQYYPLEPTDNNWIFFVLIAITGLLIYSRIGHGESYNKIMNSVLNNSIAKQLIRDQHILVKKTIYLLNIIFVSTFALLIYHISNHYSWNISYNGFLRYLIITVIITLVYFGRLILLKILAFIFNLRPPVDEYIYYITLSNNLYGFILLPVIAILSFVDFGLYLPIFHVALVLTLLMYLHRYYKGLSISSLHIKFHKFYFFIYLCAFEIIPWLIFYKIFKIFILTANT
ncbi:MAG: DUF4271 domain-containing protein [Bacteroidia bacterium]|nr:DUF4271 domain-containing protein [Bacteroidia bacterium]